MKAISTFSLCALAISAALTAGEVQANGPVFYGPATFGAFTPAAMPMGSSCVNGLCGPTSYYGPAPASYTAAHRPAATYAPAMRPATGFSFFPPLFGGTLFGGTPIGSSYAMPQPIRPAGTPVLPAGSFPMGSPGTSIGPTYVLPKPVIGNGGGVTRPATGFPAGGTFIATPGGAPAQPVQSPVNLQPGLESPFYP